MTERTSIDAFIEARDSGLIGKRQFQIIDYMWRASQSIGRTNPVTQREVQRNFRDTASSFHPRFCELERMGAIVCIGEIVDDASGRKVKAYLLGTAPTEKPAKRPQAKKILKALLEEFSIENYIYDIRERELQGWDGPKVTRFAQLIEQAKELTK